MENSEWGQILLGPEVSVLTRFHRLLDPGHGTDVGVRVEGSYCSGDNLDAVPVGDIHRNCPFTYQSKCPGIIICYLL